MKMKILLVIFIIVQTLLLIGVRSQRDQCFKGWQEATKELKTAIDIANKWQELFDKSTDSKTMIMVVSNATPNTVSIMLPWSEHVPWNGGYIITNSNR